jgi:cytochrome b
MKVTHTAEPSEPISEQTIWDLPTRAFHWLLVLCFAGAWLTAESERTKLLHLSLGYCAGALVVWRLIWGVLGSRYALFTEFIASPAAAWRYLRSYLPGARDEPAPRYVGHNPAGAWAVIGLLVLMAASVATGWWAYQDDSPDLAGSLHEAVTQALLLLVGLHVVAVLATSVLQRENLVRAMWTGKKKALQAQGIASTHRLLAIALCAAIAWFAWALYTGGIASLTG